jgi:hypothetical protein
MPAQAGIHKRWYRIDGAVMNGSSALADDHTMKNGKSATRN